MLRIIIVEGPDGAGKSTLIRALHQRFPAAHLIHHGPLPGLTEIAPIYHDAITANAGLTIIDRAWVSEMIYGAVCRDGQDRVGLAYRRMLERVALGRGVLEILCLPSMRTCERVFLARQDDEYPTSVEQLRHVYSHYQVYAATRARLPRVTYNYTTSSTEDLIHTVGLSIGWPVNLGPGSGAFIPGNLLLVGDRLSEADGTTSYPFVSYHKQGCSVWVTIQVAAAGIKERDLYWINARTVDNQKTSKAPWLAALQPRCIIAMGDLAQGWARDTGYRVIKVPHPAYWRRFHHAETYALGTALREGMINE